MLPELVKQHPFLDATRASGYAYYVIPKAMLRFGKTLGIDTDEVLLYTILKERTKLSFKNGKVEEDGRIYIYYTRQEAAKYLGWSLRKTVDVFQALADHGLLNETEEFEKNGKRTAKKLYPRMWMEPTFAFSLQDIMDKKFPAITVDNIFDAHIGDYYVLPKLLFENERYDGLSIRAILLYMVLLDRIQLSVRYGRVDDNGLVWTTLDTDIITEELGCSPRSLTRAYKELEDIGLIERKAVNYSERWRIYVRDFLPPASDATPAPTQTPEPAADTPSAPSDAKFASLSGQNCTTDSPDLHGTSAKSASADSPNLHTNKPSLKNPSLSNLSKGENIPAAASAPRDAGMPSCERSRKVTEFDYEVVEKTMALAHYDDLCDLIFTQMKDWDADRAMPILDEFTAIFEEDLRSPLPYIVLGKEPIRKDALIARYEQLNPYILFIVIEKVIELGDGIRDRAAYLRRALYQAPDQHKDAAYHLRKEIGMDF